MVINYDAPPDPEDYVHRVGRTARAETTGIAITLVNENDQRRLSQIEALIGNTITRMPLPPGMGDSPVFDPKAKRPGKGDGRRDGKGPRTGSSHPRKSHGKFRGKGGGKPDSGRNQNSPR